MKAKIKTGLFQGVIHDMIRKRKSISIQMAELCIDIDLQRGKAKDEKD